MNNPLFIVLFTDNDIYYGKKEYCDSGWKEIPNKSIKKIFFRIPTGDYIILSEYQKYGRYVEATQIISGTGAGKNQIQFCYVLGKRNDKVIQYKIHILSGDIKVHIFEVESDYIKSLNPEVWK